jgi:hypothetical protein
LDSAGVEEDLIERAQCMNETELRELLEKELKGSGLDASIDYETSQFLSVPEGFFAELVLTDASRQRDAERILVKEADNLRSKGITLTGIVRSLWQVRRIEYMGPARTPQGGLRTALTFGAQLESGQRTHDVFVHVTISALTVLRQKLGKEKFVMYIGWSPDKGDVDEQNISAAIRIYLEVLLQTGGMSYWDPLTHSELELNESAMSYVLGQSPAFQELHAAITDAFSESVVGSFLRSLNVSGGNLSRFETVLPEFSNMLGGAFRVGQRFSISANELFNSLNGGERELIRQYVSLCTERVKLTHPELVTAYPKMFANA